MRRALLIATCLLASAPAQALAHAQPESTSPQRGAVLAQQPERVEIDFDEPVEGNFGAVRVYDGNGARVDRGEAFHPAGVGKRIAARLRPGLPRGSYTATYRVVSADGHVVSGGFVFSVGRASAAGQTVEQLLSKTRSGPVTATAFAVTRAVGYMALALALGALSMTLWLWPAERAGATAVVDRRCRYLLTAAAVTGTVAAAAAIVLEAAQGAGVGVFTALRPETLREVVGTRFGTVWTIAAASWLMILIATVSIARIRTAAWLIAAPLAFLLCAPALSGHAAANDTALLLPANVLHVSAMALWLGGLISLLVAVPRGRRPAAAIARFSHIALVALVGLLLTGLLQAIVEIRDLDLVLSTAYGRAVLIKLGLLIALIGLGAVNRLKGVYRTTLKLEVAIIVVVLAVSGALAGYAPARSAQAGPFNVSTDIGPQRMDLTLDPAVVGANSAHIYMTDPRSGAQSDIAKQVTVEARMPAKGIGPLTEQALKSGPGHYTIAGLALGVRGHWELTIVLRVSDFDQFERTIGLEIR